MVDVHLLNGSTPLDTDIQVVRHSHAHSPYSSNAQAVFGKYDALSTTTATKVDKSTCMPKNTTRKANTVGSNGIARQQEPIGRVTHKHVDGATHKPPVHCVGNTTPYHHKPVVGKPFSVRSSSSDSLKRTGSYKGGTPVSHHSGVSYHRPIPASKSLDYESINIPKGIIVTQTLLHSYKANYSALSLYAALTLMFYHFRNSVDAVTED